MEKLFYVEKITLNGHLGAEQSANPRGGALQYTLQLVYLHTDMVVAVIRGGVFEL